MHSDPHQGLADGAGDGNSGQGELAGKLQSTQVDGTTESCEREFAASMVWQGVLEAAIGL